MPGKGCLIMKYYGYVITKIKLVSKISPNVVTMIVSIVAAYFTYTIEKQQSDISKLQYSPIFVIQKSLDYDEHTKKYNTERLSIINEGSPILNFSKKIESFIIAKKTTNAGVKKIYIPVVYFLIGFTSNGGKGKLAELLDENNNSYAFNLSNELNEFSLASKDELISIKIVSTVELTYTQVDGETKKSFYIDESITTEGEYEKFNKNGLNIPKVNINNVSLDYITKLIDSTPYVEN